MLDAIAPYVEMLGFIIGGFAIYHWLRLRHAQKWQIVAFYCAFFVVLSAVIPASGHLLTRQSAFFFLPCGAITSIILGILPEESDRK